MRLAGRWKNASRRRPRRLCSSPLEQESNVQENLSEAAEKLASRLVRQWGEELRRSISEELQPVLEAEITRAGHEAAFVIASDLIRLLQAANQVEILSVLLQTTQPFAARAGLLILRGGFFMGWQSRGMRDASAFTRISIPANDRVIERLAKERQPMRLQAAEMGDVFASAAPAGPGDIYLFPLLIRDRLAGVVYADGGLTDSVVQVEVVQAMSLIACIAVETASLRKPAGSGAMQPGTSPEPVRPSPCGGELSRPEPPPAAIPVRSIPWLRRRPRRARSPSSADGAAARHRRRRRPRVRLKATMCMPRRSGLPSCWWRRSNFTTR